MLVNSSVFDNICNRLGTGQAFQTGPGRPVEMFDLPGKKLGRQNKLERSVFTLHAIF